MFAVASAQPYRCASGALRQPLALRGAYGFVFKVEGLCFFEWVPWSMMSEC